MIYGYIRVSTEKQSTQVQKYEIQQYCLRIGMSVDVWFNETISEHTKEGLAASRRAGIALGRPKGTLSRQLKLDSYRSKIEILLQQGIPKVTIARLYRVNPSTLYDYIRHRGL